MSSRERKGRGWRTRADHTLSTRSCCIAFYESRYDPEINQAFEQLQDHTREEYDSDDQDPETSQADEDQERDRNGLEVSKRTKGRRQSDGDREQDRLRICKVSFAELKRKLPDTKVTIEDEILEEASFIMWLMVPMKRFAHQSPAAPDSIASKGAQRIKRRQEKSMRSRWAGQHTRDLT